MANSRRYNLFKSQIDTGTILGNLEDLEMYLKTDGKNSDSYLKQLKIVDGLFMKRYDHSFSSLTELEQNYAFAVAKKHEPSQDWQWDNHIKSGYVSFSV